jgi:cyclic beta-1,2-glucan synthetase
MLSHDLFEGTFARAALATDIELVEDYPDHFESDARGSTAGRAATGSCCPGCSAAAGRRKADGRAVPIPALGRWKMLDNLRRTLIGPASCLVLFLGWTVPSLSPGLWTLFVLLALGFPSLLPFLYGLDPRATSISWRSHFAAVLADLWVGLCRIALDLVFLAQEAWLKADAMVRTLWRLFVSHRHLLQWVTAAQSSFTGRYEVGPAYARLRGGVILGRRALRARCWPCGPSSMAIAAPLIVLWAAAPAVAIAISRPPAAPREHRLSAAESFYLRGIARRTWRFFEEFVTAEQSFLPPDNFQEDPHPVVAHRTSPTNLGMYLLSVLTARDFGWISTLEAVERLEATLESMGRLERHRGHFFNWYDTSNLRTLEPRYVSTVDSGNLAAHLMALAHGCRDLLRYPGSGMLAFEGARRAHAPARGRRPAAEATPKPTPRALELEAAMTTLAGSLAEPGALEETRFVALRADLNAVSRTAPRSPTSAASPRTPSCACGRARSTPACTATPAPSPRGRRRGWRCGWRRSSASPRPPRARWTSRSSSTTRASCSRSATAPATTASTRASTTCSPRRRG